MRFSGRAALVTGAGRGIGSAIAVRLASEGAKVVVNDLRETDDSRETLERIRAAGGDAQFVAADVSRVADVTRLVESAFEQYGQLDILVNNAGIEKRAAFWDVSERDYDAVMNVNLKGAFFAAQAFVKVLRDRKRTGVIVNVSSVHEDLPFPNFTPYCLSKGGMQMLARNLAVELGPLGIRVNNVAPGAIRTPINATLLDRPELLARLCDNISLARLGSPEDVAGVVAFLASDEASYVTGTTYYVDGGLTWHYEEQ